MFMPPGSPRAEGRSKGSILKALASITLVSATLVLGCGGPATEDAFDIESLPILQFKERLRLGSLEDADVGFSRVGGVSVDPAGRIYVAEYLDKNIRVYDLAGRHVRTIGGEGEGPGEFRDISGFGVVGDTIWAIDVRLRRMTLFDSVGEVLTTGPIEGVAVSLQDQESDGYVVPVALRRDGYFMGRMTRFSRRVETTANGVAPSDTVRVPRIRFFPTGEVADTIGWDLFPPPVDRSFKEVEVAGVRYRVPRPPSDQPGTVNLAETQWVVERPLAVSPQDGFFSVTRIGDNQDTIFTHHYRYKPQEYSPESLDALAFGQFPMPAVFSPTGPPVPSGGARLKAVQDAIREAMEFPRFQPPVQEFRAGEDGTLWLRREEMGGQYQRWLVIGPAGIPRGYVEVPRVDRLQWVSSEEFIVAQPDGLDVPWVVVWSLEE